MNIKSAVKIRFGFAHKLRRQFGEFIRWVVVHDVWIWEIADSWWFLVSAWTCSCRTIRLLLAPLLKFIHYRISEFHRVFLLDELTNRSLLYFVKQFFDTCFLFVLISRLGSTTWLFKFSESVTTFRSLFVISLKIILRHLYMHSRIQIHLHRFNLFLFNYRFILNFQIKYLMHLDIFNLKLSNNVDPSII